ncbi:hypothetical protein H1R20_g921, partial [Candolleomyces eurysporus]
MSSSEDSSSGSESATRPPTPEPNGSQPGAPKETAPADLNDSQSETQEDGDGYPATALINILLQHYGIDFPKYKRNINTFHKLFERWKSVYDAILALMGKVEAATETPDWDSFLYYTAAIGPLEEQLLGLESSLADSGKSGVPTKDGVEPLVLFMGNWIVNRKALIDTSTALDDPIYTVLFDQAHTPNAAAEVKQALNSDDKQVLQELNVGIQNHGLKDSDISGSGGEKLVTAVKSKVQVIHDAASLLAPDDHERMGKIVYAIMGIFIPFLAHDDDGENAHIVSKEVWAAAKVFAEETEKFAQKSSTMSSDIFEQKWNTYYEILKGDVGEFAMQMLTLMRQAAQVRRPFFGRTVGIVRMWQALSGSSKLRGEKQRSVRMKVQKLLSDTEAEFKETQKLVNSFDQSLKATVDTRQVSYNNLVDKIKIELKTYSPDKLAKLTEEYDKGAKVDDEHLEKYHAFIKANERAAELKAQIRV